MKTKGFPINKRDSIAFISKLSLPDRDLLLEAFRELSEREDLYIVGGAVRDFLLGRPLYDLDIAVKRDPFTLATKLATKIKGTPVPLSEEFGIYRVAKGKYTIDFCLYRGDTIEDDLRERDFTINAMAIPLRGLFGESFEIFDPLGGIKDLKEGMIRAIEEKNLITDPLRILRGYRFLAQGYGRIEEKTEIYFQKHKEKLLQVAPERIQIELHHILTSNATLAFKKMVEDGVFEVLFPEFKACRGLPQPTYHHLDVFFHNLEAFYQAEEILKNPSLYLNISEIPTFFTDEDFIITVKLASLFHDLGKGYTFRPTDERITFYRHEKIGASLWMERAKKLRFKGEIIERVLDLIKNHMRPCHLLKEKETNKLTLRAKRKLIKDCPDLYALWVVALADSLASKGVDKEPDFEARLNEFFKELIAFKEDLERVEKKERLLTGKDLISLGFTPSPLFKIILEEVELKALEGQIKSREDALQYVIKNFQQEMTKTSNECP